MTLDLRHFERNGAPTIIAVSAMHVTQAVVMAVHGKAGSTALIGLEYTLKVLDGPVGVLATASALVVGSLLAIYASLFHIGWPRVLFFIPQQFLLFCMAGAGVYATILGSYLDGTPMDRAHLFNDQIVYLSLAVVYSLAILRRCWDRHYL